MVHVPEPVSRGQCPVLLRHVSAEVRLSQYPGEEKCELLMLRYQVLITVKNVANQPQIPELAPVLIRKKTFF